MATVRIDGVAYSAAPGELLLHCLPASLNLETPCGGQGRCGKCRVVVRGAVNTPTAEERRCLTSEELNGGVRLACCTSVLGDCEVLTAFGGNTYVRVDGRSAQIGAAPLFRHLGAAVDIGTTTLAACLYAPDGKLLSQAGSANPQARWGADVISRLGAALRGEGQGLADSIRKGINELLSEMTQKCGMRCDEIDGLVMTGNTAMLYLLTGTDPEGLCHAPFHAERVFGETLLGGQLGLCCPEAAVYLPKCCSAFVGADISTALLDSGIAGRPGIRLLVDIGTNGEMVLSRNGWLLCCATAAGPAFEGAGLSMGMPGRDGAIDHVELKDGLLDAHVLGQKEPIGICGSGVIDALACLLETGQVDESGYMTPAPAVIAGTVALTQADVRAIQLAKSAIYAGIMTLLKTAGASLSDVEEVVIAGGFGSYLNPENAVRIGMIPEALLHRIRVVGNGALKGACRILLDTAYAEGGEALAEAAETVELSTDPYFIQTYMDGMFF